MSLGAKILFMSGDTMLVAVTFTFVAMLQSEIVQACEMGIAHSIKIL